MLFYYYYYVILLLLNNRNKHEQARVVKFMAQTGHQTLCCSMTDQCHKADTVWVFSRWRNVKCARQQLKCDAAILVSSSQTHWRRSSCLRLVNVTNARHLANEVDINRLACRTAARSNFRRATIAVSRAAYQRRNVLRNVPSINDITIYIRVLTDIFQVYAVSWLKKVKKVKAG